ncbi:MAG: hypothetical protein HOB64_10910 [Rhodospirillaceae bacterium]|nr:hypothetical protein [Rhodospirillaceae bacterium]MBT6858558.1 hypothetical protein [Rhodospirillaceae bacterium]
MLKQKFAFMTATALAALLAAGPALAQKSKDEVRLAIIDMFPTIDAYHSPSNETGQWARAYYSRIISFDEHNKKLVPELAKSWKRIDEKTIEFELRDDLKFSSGNKFTAEDIAYTIRYLADPKLRIRFKSRYNWHSNIEVLSPTKIRLTGKKRKHDDLFIYAYRFQIFDKGVHSKMEDKATYGAKSASTTGPYKLIKLDRKSGAHIQRNEDTAGYFPHRRAPIKNVKGISMPDRQTQVAALLTGQIDVLRNPTPDMIKEFRKNPDLRITSFPTRFINYITLDAAGRSKNKKFMDIRVRQAFIKAIDREKIIKNFVAGEEVALRPTAVCYPDNIACSHTINPLGYDPAGSKRLLAEAGFPNGFDMELSAFAPYKEIAEAIAGELRKVGIRATVRAMPLPVYTKRRGRGELTALYAGYPTFAQPNTSNLMNFFFGANRDYSKDPIIQNARKTGNGVMDLKKRTAIYQKAMDQVNKQSYILPFVEQPNVYAHHKSVEVKTGMTSKTETRPPDYFWK